MAKITLPQVAQIAKRNPELKMVVNHLAGFNLKNPNAVSEEWKNKIHEIANQPNVYIKISALFQSSAKGVAPMNLAYYQPCLGFLVQQFGENRIIYGSNWPVSDKYADIKKLILLFCQGHDKQFAEKLFYKNAVEFYGLPPLTIKNLVK